jgi:hypothetical protein
LSLLDREAQPRHLEKLGPNSVNDSLVARRVLGNSPYTRDRTGPGRRVAGWERIVEDLIDVRRRPLNLSGVML